MEHRTAVDPMLPRALRYRNSDELLLVSCTVSVSLALAHSSESSCPTGADVSACGRSPLSFFPALQRQHPTFRPPQSLPSLAARLNLRASRTPRTRLARASRPAVFLAADIFSSCAPSVCGRTRRPLGCDLCPHDRRSTTGCRGGTAGSSSVLSASTETCSLGRD